VVGRVRLHRHKPKDFDHFRDKEDKFGPDHHTPALGVGHPVSVHETPYPDHEGDNSEFPEVNKGNGKVFQGLNDLQNSAFRPVLQELKSGSFIFDEGNFNKKEQ
jgi:hypothetical protein